MVTWILFVQTPYNNDMIKYITSELDEATYLSYYKFLEYVKQYPVLNFTLFKKELDSFQTIYLNCKTGEWEIKKPVINTDVSFDELSKLNKDKLFFRDKRGELNKESISIPKAKKFINNFISNKYNKEKNGKSKSTKNRRINIFGKGI